MKRAFFATSIVVASGLMLLACLKGWLSYDFEDHLIPPLQVPSTNLVMVSSNDQVARMVDVQALHEQVIQACRDSNSFLPKEVRKHHWNGRVSSRVLVDETHVLSVRWAARGRWVHTLEKRRLDSNQLVWTMQCDDRRQVLRFVDIEHNRSMLCHPNGMLKEFWMALEGDKVHVLKIDAQGKILMQD